MATFLKGRFNPLKRLFEGKPTFLVAQGVIDQRELLRVRITLDELLSEVRQQGYGDIGEIDTVILEESGKFSILPRAAKVPPTAEDLGIKPIERGYALPIICDGALNEENLMRLGRDHAFVAGLLAKKGLAREDVFLLTLDANGETALIEKERKS